MIAMNKQTIRWVQISKERAKERWAAGDLITLVPCRLNPGNPLGRTFTVDPACYMNRAGGVATTAFNLMYDEWAHRNTSYEAGAYAHYYVAKPAPKAERLEDVICEGRR